MFDSYPRTICDYISSLTHSSTNLLCTWLCHQTSSTCRHESQMKSHISSRTLFLVHQMILQQ
ncbi:hypothetical protein BKA67DRAFT_543891 [Truncatella angustata]|uniref:Uncharacterized protein n=1 Tax=Truncatella angustata TaxID=152316 RepID=A0A9P9A3G7_9PEZI|nr:uncharacterized protein BKA67DRAFT_543891 [Truncatella angustata]KAH6659225.1 hypothetical protein BKA67DRAFT_543891 [Truncatella angustata]